MAGTEAVHTGRLKTYPGFQPGVKWGRQDACPTLARHAGENRDKAEGCGERQEKCLDLWALTVTAVDSKV